MTTDSTSIYSPAEKAEILQRANAHCIARGMRLTPTRREILFLVLNHSGVVKAYDLLNELQQSRANAAPPTVYRALDFFVDVGILHRAESLNGFIFCPHFHHEHSSIIISCKTCGKVIELPAAAQIESLANFCLEQQFVLENTPLIVNGQCVDCR